MKVNAIGYSENEFGMIDGKVANGLGNRKRGRTLNLWYN